MTVSAETEAHIRRLFFGEHWRRGTIAAQLAIHPDVVKRVIGQLGSCPKATPKEMHESLCDFAAFIDETLQQYPRLVATRLYDMLVARGFTGTIRVVRTYLRRVRILDRGIEVASHARVWGRRQWQEDPAHRAALLEEKRAARIPKGRDRLHAEIPGIDRLFEHWVEVGRNLGNMTIRLLDAYGADVLRMAVEEAISRGVHDPGALAVLCEQMRKNLAMPIPTILDLGAHIRDRDVVPHDLGGYDV